MWQNLLLTPQFKKPYLNTQLWEKDKGYMHKTLCGLSSQYQHKTLLFVFITFWLKFKVKIFNCSLVFICPFCVANFIFLYVNIFPKRDSVPVNKFQFLYLICLNVIISYPAFKSSKCLHRFSHQDLLRTSEEKKRERSMFCLFVFSGIFAEMWL